MAKTKVEKQTDATINIPTAIRDEAKPKSAADMLASLSGRAKPAAKAADKKKDRPVMQLSPEGQDLYRRFVPAKQLLDAAEAEVKAVTGELNLELQESWQGTLWANKSMPTNPAIEVFDDQGRLDCKGMYVVQERFKLQIPDNNDPTGSVTRLLVDLGVDEAKAEQLVENEVDFTPQTSLRPFNELLNGHYDSERQFVESTAAEKAIAQKLLEFVTTNLSADEQALVLQNTPKSVVKKGFLQRVAGYANTQGQLASILKVFIPVVQNRSAKFAVSDSPVERANRLVEYAKQLLGKKNDDDSTDNDD